MTVREDEDDSTPACFSTLCSCRHARKSGAGSRNLAREDAPHAVCSRSTARRHGFRERSILPAATAFAECNARVGTRPRVRPPTKP